MPVRVAFLSTAHIHTKSFIKDLATPGLDAKVVAIWDDSEQRGRAYATAADAVYHHDLEALLADDDVDAWVICDANTRHLPLLQKALPTGKPVFCEKPLTTTAGDAQQVAALLRKHATPLCCGYFQPFSAQNRAVKQAITAGDFGRVTHGFYRNSHHACYGRWFDSPDLQWFVDPALSGGGALMDMGAHAVHLLRHLVGPVESVQAGVSNVSGVYPAVDDYGWAALDFASGAVGRAEASWVQHSATNCGLEIWGSEAGLTYVGGKPALQTAGKEPRLLPHAEARPDRMARLVAMVRQELDPAELKEDLQACLDEAAIMEAAYRSAQSGQREPVPSILF